VKALYEQDMDVMLGDDINKLLEGGYYLLCQDCMGHLLPDNGDINILEINIDMFLYYIFIFILGHKLTKIHGKEKTKPKSPVPLCGPLDMQNKGLGLVWFGYLMWTTDPDQARRGLLLWWKKLNKIPFLVQTHKRGYTLLNNRWTSSGNCAFSLGQESYPMSQNELVL
jgi:hypothetical protein